jgi:glycosyltransferase involved in cell wall biosynthesis
MCRVSVVVPAFNNADHIALTLDSILSQDFGDFEVVVADHSSRDATAEVIARYATDPRVRILPPTPAGGGALANWNRVSSHARGDLIKLVCGDDLIAPGALRAQVEAFDAHPSAVLVACKRDLIDALGQTVVRSRGLGKLTGLVPGRVAVRASVLAGTNIFGEPGCVMFRRDVLELEGGWDNAFPYLIDQASYTRIMMHGDMVAIPSSLASFRISAGQWSVRLMKEQAMQAVAFHEDLHARVPGLLSRTDLVIGNAKARAMAVMRRLAYAWLRRRM